MIEMKKPQIRVLVAAMALAASGVLGACSSDTAADSTGAPAAEAAQGVQSVGVEEFQAAIESGAEVIDVRTPAEFAEGHLEGAVNIDINSPTFADQITALNKNTTYAVYCRSGNRSATATDYMAQQGFTSVFNLDAGIIDWQSAGLPVV